MADSLANFVLSAGGVSVRVYCPRPALYQELRRHYAGFLAEPAGNGAPFEVRVLPPGGAALDAPERPLLDFIPDGVQLSYPAAHPDRASGADLLARTGWVRPAPDRELESVDYFLRVVFALLAYEGGGLMFHAAGIVRQGRARLFFGPSGAGKTTVARLSPDGVLNDDLVILKPAEDGWVVYGTPFWNPTQARPGGGPPAKLASLFRLVQDQQTFIRPASQGRMLAEMLASVPVLSGDAARCAELVRRCEAILSAAPAYYLYFRQDASFWKAIVQAERRQLAGGRDEI